MPEIPVIDLAAPGTEAAFAEAYGTLGFGYVVNHGLDEALIEAVFAVSRQFHALPIHEKVKVELNRAHRGYIPINTSTDVTTDLAEVTTPNQSESFMMMREDAVADPDVYLSGPNQWPALPGFRAVLESYHAQMCGLGRNLMQIALRSIGADMMAGMAGFEVPTTWLRLLHYPPQPDVAGLYGSAPHRDFGALTILAQDRVGGLQVMTPEGGWLDAPWMPGAFVVNVGDMLHRMSNGRLISTPHRVINRSGAERYSVPFFYDPHVNTVIRPLPGTGEPEFEPLLFADFLRGELEAGYDRHKTKT